jgi:TatA/E family protein of Tat protein translocase
MLNLDPGKLLVIAVVAVIVLGPDKLPHFARQVGGAWRSFNDFRQRMEHEVRSNIPDLPSTSEMARLVRNPNALLQHLGNMSSDSSGVTLHETFDSSEAVVGPEPVSVEPAMSWVTRDYLADSQPEPGQASPVLSGDAGLN